MRIIYYSMVFDSEHGGSNHSFQFVYHSKNHPEVESLEVFPIKTHSNLKLCKVSRWDWLKSFPLFLVPRFFKRNRHHQKELFQFIEYHRPDVLIMRPDNNFLQLTRIKREFPEIFVVAEVNSSPFDESYREIPFKFYFKKLESRVYSKLDLNFFVTENLRFRVMGENSALARDLVVANGTDPKKFSRLHQLGFYKEKIGISRGKRVIGYVGTLDIHKKVGDLVQAFALLQLNHKDLHLLIVGEGPEREKLQAQVKSLGLESSVDFVGWIDYNLIHEYLFALDVAVHHHSNSYCCPLKILDYLGAGIPTIGPEIPFVLDNFEDGKHLLVTKSGDKQIANSISKLLSDPSFARSLASTGRDFVCKNFTWEKSTNQIIDQIVLTLNAKN